MSDEYKDPFEQELEDRLEVLEMRVNSLVKATAALDEQLSGLKDFLGDFMKHEGRISRLEDQSGIDPTENVTEPVEPEPVEPEPVEPELGGLLGTGPIAFDPDTLDAPNPLSMGQTPREQIDRSTAERAKAINDLISESQRTEGQATSDAS